MVIWGARNLLLKPEEGSFHVVLDEDSGDHSAHIIILEGWAEQASFYPDKRFWCQVTEVSDDFQHETVTLKETSIQEEREVLQYGYASLENLFDEEGEETDEERLEIYIRLKPRDFSETKYMVGKSIFLGTMNFIVALSVYGMKLGYELGLDKFPRGERLPIVGFDFILAPKKTSEDED